MKADHWNGISEKDALLRSVFGYANFVAMVLPEKGKSFKAQAKDIYEKHTENKHQSCQGKIRKSEFRRLAAAGQAPYSGWLQAQPKAIPIKEKTAEELKTERQQAQKQGRQIHQSTSTRQSGFVNRNGAAYDQLVSLGTLNQELSESLLPLMRDSSHLKWLYSYLFEREQIKRVATCHAKIDIMTKNMNFHEQAIQNPAYIQQQLERFNKLTENIYRQPRNTNISKNRSLLW